MWANGDGDLVTVIKGTRVEQVHKVNEVAVAGRHDKHKETWMS